MRIAKLAYTIITIALLAISTQEPGKPETKAPIVEQTLTGSIITLQEPVIASYTVDDLPVCTTGTFKSWMDYTKITAKSTMQWRLQQTAVTDYETGIRMYQGVYMVAMSRRYGLAGTELVITFEDGQMIDVIIGDIKGGTDCAHSDGSMIEFIIDMKAIPSWIKESGNYNDMFAGKIVSIQKWQKRESAK